MVVKRTSLVILVATATVCSRAFFFFLNDPEGPNLLVVLGLAVPVFLSSYAAYIFIPSRVKGTKRLAAAICIQVLSVIGLYFCLT
jgi:hypothetical protein